jgi:hypothetical protein
MKIEDFQTNAEYIVPKKPEKFENSDVAWTEFMDRLVGVPMWCRSPLFNNRILLIDSETSQNIGYDVGFWFELKWVEPYANQTNRKTACKCDVWTTGCICGAIIPYKKRKK